MGEEQKNSRHLLVLAATAVTLGLAAALARGWELGVRGEWVWRHNRLPTLLAPALAAGLLLVIVVAVACRPGRWNEMRPAWRVGLLALLVLLALALQWGLLTAAGSPLVSWVAPGWIVASPNATTYFSVSFEVVEVRDWLASYPEHMGALPHHARTHPPGFVLFFLLVRRLCAALTSHPAPVLEAIADGYNRTFGTLFSPADAAAAMVSAALIAFAGALSLIPLYLLARGLVGAEGAVCGVGLMAGMPGLLLLGASPDQLILALAITTLWLCYSAWRRGSVVRAFLAGITVAVGLLFSLSFAVAGAWLLAWVAIGVLGSRDRSAAARRALVGAAIALAGFVLFHLALYLICGYRPLAVAQQAFLAHREITTTASPRTYWKWLLMNPIEAAVFAGLPLVLTALWSARALRREPEWARLRPFLAAWLTVVALLDLSGTVRGEVGRIWLFLFWPVPLTAGTWLAGRERASWLIAALALLQVTQVILMREYLTIYSIL